MDRKDFTLTEALTNNSRVSYRELAERSGLSINSVHKRIQFLIDKGTIEGFIARLGPAVERYIIATAFGKTESTDVHASIEEMGRDERTSQVVEATHDYIYPQWYLRDISELEEFVRFVGDKGRIESPDLAFRTVPPPAGHERVRLSGLDYRIIAALMDNSRRPLKDVGEELGVSHKTVQRRLARMQREGSITLTTSFLPTATTDLFCFFHTNLKKDADRREAISYLEANYEEHFLDATLLDNLPNYILCQFWTNTMKQLKEVRVAFEQETFVDSFFVTIFYDSHKFDTWREDLVRKRAARAARRV